MPFAPWQFPLEVGVARLCSAVIVASWALTGFSAQQQCPLELGPRLFAFWKKKADGTSVHVTGGILGAWGNGGGVVRVFSAGYITIGNILQPHNAESRAKTSHQER